jgi:hypothetical protein
MSDLFVPFELMISVFVAELKFEVVAERIVFESEEIYDALMSLVVRISEVELIVRGGAPGTGDDVRIEDGYWLSFS